MDGNLIEPDDLDEEGCDYTCLYSDIEKLIDRKAQGK